MRTISIISQKGGCGRTTTAVNLAAALAETGKKVLLIDLDPKAHVTAGLGCNPDSCEKTICDALLIPAGGVKNLIVRTDTGLDLVPSNMLLAGARAQLANAPDGHTMLARCLRSVGDMYRFCVIDCPPSLGVLTRNALAASTDVIIPIQSHYYTVDAMAQLFETIGAVRDRVRFSVAENIDILLTFADRRGVVSRKVQRRVRHTFAGHVFCTVIRRNIKLAEAPGAAVPVLAYAPRSHGAEDYKALAEEVLQGKPHRRSSWARGRRRGIPKRLAPILTKIWGPRRRGSARFRLAPAR